MKELRKDNENLNQDNTRLSAPRYKPSGSHKPHSRSQSADANPRSRSPTQTASESASSRGTSEDSRRDKRNGSAKWLQILERDLDGNDNLRKEKIFY